MPSPTTGTTPTAAGQRPGAVLAFITVESGGSPLVPVGSDYAPVVAGAYDGIGAPMAGIQIFMFAPNFPGQPGGTFPDGTNYNIQTTDATGRCTFEPLTANALPGTLNCYIADNAAGAPNVNFVLTQATAEPAAVQIVAGSPVHPGGRRLPAAADRAGGRRLREPAARRRRRLPFADRPRPARRHLPRRGGHLPGHHRRRRQPDGHRPRPHRQHRRRARSRSPVPSPAPPPPPPCST